MFLEKKYDPEKISRRRKKWMEIFFQNPKGNPPQAERTFGGS